MVLSFRSACPTPIIPSSLYCLRTRAFACAAMQGLSYDSWDAFSSLFCRFQGDTAACDRHYIPTDEGFFRCKAMEDGRCIKSDSLECAD